MPSSPLRRTSVLTCLVVLAAAGVARAELGSALDRLREVGPEGAGNAEATRAWAEVAAAPSEALPRVLLAMGEGSDRARNYLFAAAMAIADRHLAEGKSLPVAELGDFLRDTSRHPRARRLAFELLERADARLAAELLPGLLDDPAPELRREAVQRRIDVASATLTEGRREAATVLYEQVLGFAREADQIEAITRPLKELGRPVDLIRQLGFLVDWNVIGPFDNTGGAGFERAYGPESEWRLDGEYEGKSGPVRWKKFRATHEFGMVDFNQALARLKEVAGYAYTEFHSPRPQVAELRLGCKNGWKIWLNGRFLFGRDEYHRGAELDQYRLPIELRAGSNSILVKLTQNEMQEDWTVEWEFQLRITDPTGRVLRSEPATLQTASSSGTLPSVIKEAAH